ncbi:MAG: hypothetical protein EPN56_07745 [Rhodanobacter sp.]|nr:MAG: hypothetical protein EPN78_10315 [Rhodanobacter sp.]TAM08936.1 MAG: hypothetical protein EPN66_11640 [Rhodanobacter sp.]TAM35954.1 MAG: hypothetical protein EPN56_07745 [Rhodanobacter sp.]
MDTRSALQVRWLLRMPAMPRHPAPATAVARAKSVTRARATRAIRTVQAVAPVAASASTRPFVAVPAAHPLSTPLPAPDYVPGRRRLAAPEWQHSRPRLPGSREPAHGAPLIAMADPRTQGAAGVVRFIGTLAGAVDPHCVDVDAWRGMTARERIAHHVDPDAITATVERYGCAPPPAPPGSPAYLRTSR